MSDESAGGQWRRVFVLGGVRSGKSRFALQQASELAGNGRVRFVATAEFAEGDESMRDRVARHVAARPADWTTVEEPRDLAGAVSAIGDETVVLIDCLTLWISNLMADCGDPDVEEFRRKSETAVESSLGDLLRVLPDVKRYIIMVANDVGSGVAPPTRLGNVFADMQGTVNQRIAAVSDEVYHMVAGIPNRIK